MLIRIVRMTFDPSGVGSFKAIFDRIAPQIRSFEGCLGVELLRDVRFPNIFVTYSRWDSDESLQAYRRSELFAETWAQTKKLFAAPPVASSYHIGEPDPNVR